jgi:hypothetical protein
LVSHTAHESDETQWHSRRMPRLLVGVLLAAFFFSIGVFAIFVMRDTKPNTLLFEGAKILPQVGLVLVGGAALSLLTFEYQQTRRKMEEERDEERRREEYRQELLKTTLAQATASYTEIKRARRLMRGLALRLGNDQPPAILTSDYDKQMVALIDAQLQFENLVHDVETSATAFTSAPTLEVKLKGVENHLSQLITEYEKVRPKFSGEHPRIPLDELPLLDSFLARFEDKPEKFREGFEPLKSGFLKVQELIRSDLLR